MRMCSLYSADFWILIFLFPVVVNDREEFRKSFKENFPENKSVSVVRFENFVDCLLFWILSFVSCVWLTRKFCQVEENKAVNNR